MIYVIEPQCHGIEHSGVNSALLIAISIALPESKIIFLAEARHILFVKDLIPLEKQENIIFKSIQIPQRDKAQYYGFYESYKFIQTLKKIFYRQENITVIFSSITTQNLLFIKILFRINSFKSIYVIPHSILETTYISPSIKIWKYLFSFKYIMKHFNFPRLKYLLYGRQNRENILKLMPKLGNYIVSVDLPYHFSNSHQQTKSQSNQVIFGSFGFGQFRKGTEIFFKLAKDIHEENQYSKSSFILIGHISENDLKLKVNNYVLIPSEDNPLNDKEFSYYGNLVDYSVFCFDKTKYRLTISGSFYDSISYLKPCIALKTPFFEYYFRKFGDIGYLCDDYEHMKKIINDIMEYPNQFLYETKVNNIKKMREKLSVNCIASELKDILI